MYATECSGKGTDSMGNMGGQSEEVEQKSPDMSRTTEPSNIYLKDDKIYLSLLGHTTTFPSCFWH